jgi:O-antigen ligase
MQQDDPQTTLQHYQHILEKYVPLLLPLLLVFSRATADITVLLIGLTFLLKSYQANDWSWLKQIWFKLSILFWLYLLLINAPLSVNPVESYTHAIFYLRWPLFAMALSYWLFIDEHRQRDFLIVLFVVFLFVFFDTTLQYFIERDLFGHLKASPTRLTGPYSRPVPGIMMLRIIFIVLFLNFMMPLIKNARQGITFILSMLLIGLLFIFITGERMALILCSSGSIVVMLGILANHQISIKKTIMALLVCLVLFSTLLFTNPEMAERSIYSIIEKLTNFKTSDYGYVFRSAFAAWQQYPILGSGFHTYNTVCKEMGLLAEWGMQCSHPHNLYLHIAAETGMMGLLLFIASIVSIYFRSLKHLIKSKQWLKASLCFSVLSVCFWPLIGGISILNNGVAALVWLGVGWVLSVVPLYNEQIKAT